MVALIDASIWMVLLLEFAFLVCCEFFSTVVDLISSKVPVLHYSQHLNIELFQLLCVTEGMVRGSPYQIGN